MKKSSREFTPAPKILKNYARVMVDFALHGGSGMKQGEVVQLVVQKPGLPLAHEIYQRILEKGGHPMLQLLDDNFRRLFFEKAGPKQLAFFPKKFYRGLSDTVDHWVRILADSDPLFLNKIPPRKIITRQVSNKPFQDWLDRKEDRGRFTWTLCLYGTPGMAREAGLSLFQYWQQIENACFLKAPDPVARWKTVFRKIQEIQGNLDRLPIQKLHVRAPGTDLWITPGSKRRWIGGSGRNIPSFEIFTSPDWRGTEGTIRFDLPLYRYGNQVRDIRLDFHNGRVVGAKARKNEKLLHEILRQKNADKIGEFSLTDRRFSRITRFMANTLFDENFGGKYGNMHLALGKSYHDTYSGNPRRLGEKGLKRLGFNDSPEHTDIIATSDRTVEATLKDGSRKTIYRDGMFTF